ncbi:MAG: heat-inducible transcription repressor HrcA [Acidobacteria bacterium]|nr:heat-inducible transcription repressor HrcA [Acidobacteriota bacterium]
MAKPMTSRQREILTAIIETYISTGEPISSGTLAQTAFANTMSSATIRNEMAELAESGFLEQPHTSAGRIPSAEAFRIYVSQLTSAPNASPNRPNTSPPYPDAFHAKREALHAQIETSFIGLAGASVLLERTSRVLASLSSGVGLAIGAAASTDLLEHIHFSRLAQRRVLAVVVTRSGTVRDRVLTLDHDLSSVQLETSANFLNEHFRGWNIDRVRNELARRIAHERTLYQQLSEAHPAADATDLWSRTVPPGAEQQQTVYIDGVVNLIGLPADRDRLRAMLSALEEKQRLVEILNAYVDTTEHSVRVVFDLEHQDPGMAGLVLIAAPAQISGDSTVAILGPKRMNYESAINAVSYIAQLLHRIDIGDIAPLSP